MPANNTMLCKCSCPVVRYEYRYKNMAESELFSLRVATTAKAKKKIDSSLAITLVRTRCRANPVAAADLLYDLQMSSLGLWDMMQTENCIFMFFEIYNRCKWLIVTKKPQELYFFLHIPYRCRIEQFDIIKHNGMTNSKIECMWK